MMGWGCGPQLDTYCNQATNLCTAGLWEMDKLSWSLDPVSADAEGDLPTCTKATHPESQCRQQQHCNKNVQCCTNTKDPISVADDRTTHQVSDVTLASSLGAISFERYYSPSPFSFAHRDVFGNARSDAGYDGFPFPFGSSPAYGATANWVHNWQSFVRVVQEPLGDGGVKYITTVLDPTGQVVGYPDCEALPCHLTPLETDIAQRERLYVSDGGVTLFTPSGRFVYAHRVGDRYFLSRLEDLQYAASGETTRARATLTYGNPSGCTGYDAGGMLVTAVTNAEGAALSFSWQFAGSQCVMSAVDVVKGGVAERAVTFTYDAGPGLIASARYGSDGGGRLEAYATTLSAWSVAENGIQTTRHAFSSTPTEYGQGDVTLYSKVSRVAGTCTAAGCTQADVYNWNHHVPIMGSGSMTPVPLAMRLETISNALEPVLTQETQNCEGTECSGSWTRNYSYLAAAGYGAVPGAIGNARGGYSVYAWDAGSVALPTGWSPPLELKYMVEGATDSAGNDGLEGREYIYSYGSENQSPRGFEQFVSEERQGSGFQPATIVRDVTQRDPTTNRVTATFRVGKSLAFDESTSAWITPSRTVGTFYFTQRKCTDDSADPLGRTVEVHGPCFVDSTSATDCPSGFVVPVTQYEYYAASDAGAAGNANRLYRETQWVDATDPESCSGSSLATTFGNYDVYGNPGSITDANGVTTTVVYADGRPLSTTVNGRTTSYSWDQGVLASVRHPEGNYDVYCHRQVALGSACTPTAAWSPQLQWHARAPSADGTNYTEATASFYTTDGRLSREEDWDGIRNEKRRERAYDLHSSGRPLRTTVGVGYAPYYVLKRYDADGVLTGTNDAASGTSCNHQASASAGGSNACANLKNDRLGRLLSMDLPEATQNETGRTCITYDARGNVASIRQGCPSDSTSFPGPSCDSCTQPAALYKHDDFGNLVVATLPHLGPAASGAVRLQYDARGLVTVRQTPSMVSTGARHVYSYDGLGRELSVVHTWTSPSSGSETLFSAQYDDAATLDSSCPQPSNTKGRRLNRTDSFGKTWYQYSPEGWLTGEIRLRNGTSCASRLPRDIPHTQYTYSGNGTLTSIQYPYGRAVTYTMGTHQSVTTDRPASIAVTMWDGSAWNSWTAVESISYEPFGDVRAMQYNTTTTPTSVEYFPGDYYYANNSSCPMAKPTTNDLSGRRRLIQASTGALTPDGGAGDIFQVYTAYDALKPTRIATCWGSATMQQYDPVYYRNQVATTLYSPYDVRGNRTQTSPPTTSAYDTYQYSDAGFADRLVSVTRGGSPATPPISFEYDDDGRTTAIRLPNDSSGQPAYEELWSPASNGASSNGGLDSVYKSVSVSGAVYGYYYDATNRRRLKEYPTGTTDEYFYDANNHLLVDRGNASVSSPGYFTTDEYVWLGQRPVLVVRGRLSTSDDSRSADTTSTCGRNGATESCGAYFIVTDDLPKPVAVLDDTGKHARRLNWDAFGFVNRRELRAKETSHPYANNDSAALLYEAFPVMSGMTMKYRFQLDAVDTEGTAGAPVDTVKVMHNWVTESEIGGAHRGRVFTPWVSSTGGVTYVLFSSNARNCPPEGCLTDGGLPDGGSWPYYGVSMSALETVESQSGAKAFDLPLRFPGQYYDAESQKHENWNRYYDPLIGRYFSADPMIEYAAFPLLAAMEGRPALPYGYASNSPLQYSDPSGLDITSCDRHPFACAGQDTQDLLQRAVRIAETIAGGTQLASSIEREREERERKAKEEQERAAQRQADYDRYKKYCDEQRPSPSWNPTSECSYVSRLIDHAKICIQLIRAFDNKWQPGRHAQKIQDWEWRLEGYKRDYLRRCVSQVPDCP